MMAEPGTGHDPSGTDRLAIRAAGLIDIEAGHRSADPFVILRDGIIERVGRPDEVVPQGVPVVDARPLTLMPGLIDAHVHFFGLDAPDYARYFLSSEASQAIRAVRDARALLEAGFTTVRCVGSRVDLELARAIDAGVVDGPRIVGAGQFIQRAGGPWELPGLPRELAERLDMIFDGEEGARGIVRRRVAAGAQTIKLGLSAGHPGAGEHAWGDDPATAVVEMSVAEARAIVDEAHRARLPVSAHAMGDVAVTLALDAGVDAIEHGHGISERVLRRVRDQRVVVVPTLTASWLAAGGPAGATAPAGSPLRRHIDAQVANMRRGLELGIRYAMGSDLIGPPGAPHGWNAMEYVLAVETVGMAPAESLRAGILVGAGLLDVTDQVGRIAPGYRADLVGVEGDPLVDIRALRRIGLVVRGGRIAHRADPSRKPAPRPHDDPRPVVPFPP